MVVCIYVVHVCFDLCVVYSVGVYVKLCGVICVVACFFVLLYIWIS